MSYSSITRRERRATLSLAAIFALRMFGLFMIYPVFALYARNLSDATPTRVGLALGIYGLAQALCQMPLGLLSDRIGRKRVIAGGLLIFALGSAVAALSHTVAGIIAGRFLQGAGAVGAAVLALAADLVREERRTRSMAVIGMSIGAAFALALVAGPVLNGLMGVPGMFWLTALLALGAILLLYAAVPVPSRPSIHADAEALPRLMGRVLRDPELLRLDFGILAQHAILTATFLGVPLLIRQAGISAAHEWQLYLPALLVSVVLMVPMIVQAERHGRMRPLFLVAVAVIGLVQFLLPAMPGRAWVLGIGLALFFAAFNFLEAALPSLISKRAPAEARGTAMGVYSSAQFLGIFLGGVLGGWSQSRFGVAGSFGFSLVVATLWFLSNVRGGVGRRPNQ